MGDLTDRLNRAMACRRSVRNQKTQLQVRVGRAERPPRAAVSQPDDKRELGTKAFYLLTLALMGDTRMTRGRSSVTAYRLLGYAGIRQVLPGSPSRRRPETHRRGQPLWV